MIAVAVLLVAAPAGLFAAVGSGQGLALGPLGPLGGASASDDTIELPSPTRDGAAVPDPSTGGGDDGGEAGDGLGPSDARPTAPTDGDAEPGDGADSQPGADGRSSHVTCLVEGCVGWRFAWDTAPAFPVGAADHDLVVLVDDDGSLTALDPADGQQRWATDADPPGSTVAPPLVVDDLVLHLGDRGTLAAWWADDGTPAWRTGGVTAAIVDARRVDELLLIRTQLRTDAARPGRGEQLVAIERTDGSIRWSRDAAEAVLTDTGAALRLPAEDPPDETDDDAAPAGTGDDEERSELVGLSVEDGSERWRRTIGPSLVAGAGPHVLVQDREGIEVLDATDGERRGQLPGPVVTGPDRAPDGGGSVLTGAETVSQVGADGTAWTTDLGDGCCQGAAVVGAQVHVQLGDGTAVALDRTTGTELARWELGPQGLDGAWRYGGFVLQGEAGEPLVLHDGTDGTPIAEVPTSSTPIGLTVDGGVVVATDAEVVWIRPPGRDAPLGP